MQKLAINRKSTFFVRSLWNLVKIINSWGNHFHKVSWRLDKKCRFITYGQFLNVSCFFLLRPYIKIFLMKVNMFQFKYGRNWQIVVTKQQEVSWCRNSALSVTWNILVSLSFISIQTWNLNSFTYDTVFSLAASNW